MSSATELLRRGKANEVWEKYCGFIDFSIEDFIETQRHLLLEQLELFGNCELGRKVMRGARPSSVDEFRRQVPLTTYEDYFPYLPERREDVLPEKPLFWQRTSGRSGEYRFKWIPVTERLFNEIGRHVVTLCIFASCSRRGEIRYRDRDRLLYGMAPPPYPSGALFRAFHRELVLDVFPPLGEAEVMAFQRRMIEGINMALSKGMDYQAGLPSVLVSIGEQIGQWLGSAPLWSFRSRPRALFRLAKGRVKSKLAGRPLLPRDLWKLKGLVAGGTDASILNEKIKHYWGRYALETYGSAEAGILAIQTWDYKDMILLPTIAFLEFIPEEERQKAKQESSYQPRTLLLDGLEAGKRYEVVITSLQGGPFVRYRMSDIIEVTGLRNERLDIDLPQITFYARDDGIIDIGGFTRLTEKIIGRAIEGTGLPYNGWTARKEIVNDTPLLHVYLELREQNKPPWEVSYELHRSLRKLDFDYAALEDMLHVQPLRVTLLPVGAFRRYMMERVAAGADMAHLKPPQIGAPDEVIQMLLRAEEGTAPNES